MIITNHYYYYHSYFNIRFYTELDFLNEAANQDRLKRLLLQENVTGI